MDAVIYARYSSHNQRDASIDDQVRVCTDEANRRGDRIVGIYADRARSGKETTRRPEFLRMISDSRDATWKLLYVWKQDRFARNRYDAAMYKAELKKNGVTVLSVTEPMSDGPEGILLETLMEGLAEYFSANLSENVKRGMEGNALKCMHNGAHLFGYDLGEDGFYHANKDEAPLVRRAFQMYDAGYTMGDIVRAFSSYRTRRGAPWTNARISEMLKNEKYAGTYIFKGHRVEGGMEAIVPKEMWDRVNAQLGKRHRRDHRYPLSGKLYDAHGNRFVGTSGTGRDKVYHYYKVMSTGESYTQADVEAAVYEAVGEFLASDEAMRETIAQAVADQVEAENHTEREAAEALRRRVAEIDKEADNLVALIAKTGVSDRLAKRLEELEAERADAEAEAAEAERGIPAISKETMMAFMEAIITQEAPPSIVDAFVSRVVIDGDDLIVTFNVTEKCEPSSDAPEKAVRTSTDWLPCPYLTRTSRVLIGPWGFAVSVTLRRSPRKSRRSRTN